MAMRETAHQRLIFVLPQSHLVRFGLICPLPQLSTFLYRYISFPFHLPYAFIVFPVILSFSCMFVGLVEVPIDALFGVAIFFRSVFSLALSVICGAFIIVWFSSELDWRVQRVTAKFSSSELSSHQKSSSELPSDSVSKLSSHQIPRLLFCLLLGTFATCGTTTAKELYANSFELNHYAFGSVRAQALSVLVLSTSTTGSSRRVPPPRGSRLAVPARDTPFVFPWVARWLRTRRFHVWWIRCRRPVSGTGPLPLRLCLRLHFCRRLCAVGMCSRASGRASRARSTPSLAIAAHMSSSLKVPCTVTQSTGRLEEFSRTRLSTSSTPLFPRPAQLRCTSLSRSVTARSRCPRSFGPEASFTEWLGRISHPSV